MLRARSSRRSAARVLRTREPRGIITAGEASSRLGGLVGAELVDVETSLDRLVLAVDTDPVHFVVLAGPVALVAQGTLLLDAEPSDPAAREALSMLSGREVTQVRVAQSGALRLDFDAECLVIEPDATHEAWEVRSADGDLLVCLPGGSLSLWAPTYGHGPAAG